MQQFMFRDKVHSLDEMVSIGEDEGINFTDTVASDTNLEDEVVERLTQEQLKGELWETVNQVLKHDTMVGVLRLRFIDR